MLDPGARDQEPEAEGGDEGEQCAEGRGRGIQDCALQGPVHTEVRDDNTIFVIGRTTKGRAGELSNLSPLFMYFFSVLDPAPVGSV